MTLLRKTTAAVLAAAAALLATSCSDMKTGSRDARTAPAAASGSGTLFHEDFDSLPVGSVSSSGAHGWVPDVQNGTMTVERGDSGAGRQLRIRTEGNGRAFIKLTDLKPAGNSFWARLRLRVGAFPTAPDWAHWTIAEASGSDAKTLLRPLGGQYAPTNKGNFWGVGSDLGATGDWTNWKTSVPAKAGAWQCAEFHLDAKDNRVTVYLDGVEKPELTVSTKQHGGTSDDFVFPTFDSLKLGWQLYQPNPTPSSYDIRMDDIALSADRVGGCQST
jgi:hypothetical protein